MIEKDGKDAVGQASGADMASGYGASVDGEALMNGQNEIQILFRGQKYRLSVTGSGKLLLTK